MSYRFPAVLFLMFAIVLVWPGSAGTLDTLKPDHPRVLAHAEDFDRIAKLVKSDPLAKRWYEAIQIKATEMLIDEPVAKYELRDGRRLLYVSREVLDRVETLGMLHRIEPKQIYLDRIWADMQAAAKFDHWNPVHFLDVAEMGLAFALAYDWLYDDWSDEQRKTMRDAMVRHAIKPALKAYDRDVWWTRTAINWNQVCNGGLICVALAIADDEPELAKQMLERSIKALPKSMKRYAPDGGYDEGPGYWAFGTVYNVFAIAALESALGNDFGLGDAPGFDQTGNFPIHMTGPTGKQYNFGDNKERPVSSPAMFYLSTRYDQPGNAYQAAERAKGTAFDLLWYDPQAIDGDVPTLADSAAYTSAGVAMFRSGWHSNNDWYVGAKGGWIGFGHSQMDLGSFILERNGVRWFVDLGSDDYNLPGYFYSDQGDQRWDYYRNRAEGHNTLVINPDRTGGQDYDAKAPIQCDDMAIQIDLSQAYAGKVSRRIAREGVDSVTMIDEIELDEPSEVWWFAHTKAKAVVSEDGRTVRLTEGGASMRVELISPQGARLRVMPAVPLETSPNPKGQNPNDGSKAMVRAQHAQADRAALLPAFGPPDPTQAIRKLAIKLEGVTDTRIVVKFTPLYH